MNERVAPTRAALALVGGLGFLVAAVFVADPRAAGSVPVEPLLALAGNDYFLVAAFAVFALGSVLAVLSARALSGVNQAVLPSPEEVHRVPRAGEEFDEFLAGVGPRAWLTGRRHGEIRARLYEAAVTTEMRASNCSRAEAETRVAAGDWTDDRDAAAFLSTDRTPDLATRLKAAVRGESPFQRAARRTADAVAREAVGDR